MFGRKKSHQKKSAPERAPRFQRGVLRFSPHRALRNSPGAQQRASGSINTRLNAPGGAAILGVRYGDRKNKTSLPLRPPSVSCSPTRRRRHDPQACRNPAPRRKLTRAERTTTSEGASCTTWPSAVRVRRARSDCCNPTARDSVRPLPLRYRGEEALQDRRADRRGNELKSAARARRRGSTGAKKLRARSASASSIASASCARKFARLRRAVVARGKALAAASRKGARPRAWLPHREATRVTYVESGFQI